RLGRGADPVAGREIQGLQDAGGEGRQSLPPVRRGGPGQWPYLGPVQLLRTAQRDGLTRVPGDPLPEDRPEVGHEGGEGDECRGGELVRPQDLPQGVGSGRAVTTCKPTDRGPWALCW